MSDNIKPLLLPKIESIIETATTTEDYDFALKFVKQLRLPMPLSVAKAIISYHLSNANCKTPQIHNIIQIIMRSNDKDSLKRLNSILRFSFHQKEIDDMKRVVDDWLNI